PRTHAEYGALDLDPAPSGEGPALAVCFRPRPRTLQEGSPTTMTTRAFTRTFGSAVMVLVATVLPAACSSPDTTPTRYATTSAPRTSKPASATVGQPTTQAPAA